MEVWLVVLGAVLALVSGIGTEVLRDWLARGNRRRERREDFLHGTLVEIQDEVVKLFRAASAVYHEGLRMYDEATTAELARNQVEATPLWQENRRLYRDAYFRIESLAWRAGDERLRDEVGRLLHHGNRLVYDPPGFIRQRARNDPNDPDDFREADELLRQLHRRIAGLLGDEREREGVRPARRQRWWRRLMGDG